MLSYNLSLFFIAVYLQAITSLYHQFSLMFSYLKIEVQLHLQKVGVAKIYPICHSLYTIA